MGDGALNGVDWYGVRLRWEGCGDLGKGWIMLMREWCGWLGERMGLIQGNGVERGVKAKE